MTPSGRRKSHCHPGGDYEFVLHINTHCKFIGYEIDKRRARFVNVKAQADQESSDKSESPDTEDSDLADAFHSKLNISGERSKPEPTLNLYEDSRQLATMTIPGDDEPFVLRNRRCEKSGALSPCYGGSKTISPWERRIREY